MNNKNPYLSIVITSRNDNYQGESFQRLQLAVNTFIDQAKRYNLEAEIILVEWNPPQGRPLLKDVLSLPNDLGPVIFRFIVVPSSIHKKYNASSRINIIRGADLNVGIRRAQGDFIFATNSDILFSNELIQFLASKRLDKKFFYRANRFDINRDVIKCSSPEKIIDFCKKNIIRSYPKDNAPHHCMTEHPALYINGGDFILFSREYWHLLHGWPGLNNLGLYSDGLLCYMVYLAGLKEKILADQLCVYHIDHDSRWKTLVTPKSKIFSLLKNNLYNRVSNIKCKILMRRVRHLADKFIILFPDKNGNAENRDFDLRRLRLDYEKTLIDSLTRKRSYIYNDDMWGWSQEKFEEFVISSNKIIKNKS